MITWVIFLAVGILIGIGVGLYMSRLDDEAKRTQNTLNKQLHEKDTEMAAYKEQVNSHFVKTATLVNNMTDSYRAVHEHLATGVNSLCKEGADAGVNSIPFEDKKMLAAEPAIMEPPEQLAEAENSPAAAVAEPTPAPQEPAELEAISASESESSAESDANDSAAPGQLADAESPVSNTPEQTEALEMSEADQPNTPENLEAGSNQETDPENIESDTDKMVEPAVSDIEKSRIAASRMVH